MGYDIARFKGSVDEELICPICSGVLEEPLHAPQCEHAFCKSCINEWLARQPSCPIDRQPIAFDELKPVPRILRNFLSRLSITCDHATFGCSAVIQLEHLHTHKKECEYNPKKPVLCKHGCGLVIPKDEQKDHNCVRDVRVLLQKQQSRVIEIQSAINDLRKNIDKLKLNCIVKTCMEECLQSVRLNVESPSTADVIKQHNIS